LNISLKDTAHLLISEVYISDIDGSMTIEQLKGIIRLVS
jgi:hypothetical protein